MRNRLLKAVTLLVALGFVIGATFAAGGDKAKSGSNQPVDPPAATADAGEKPRPTFLPATKAALPMHFQDPAPSPAPQQQQAPRQQAAQPAPKP